MDPPKMHAKGPDESSHSKTERPVRESSDRESAAEVLLSKIRQQLRTGEIRTAKRLASEAAEQHPKHAEILDIHRILNEGRSFAKPGTGRDMRLEYRWLRDPPAEYRGKWIALIGDAVVGSAATLQKLQESLPPDLDQTPLAVQIPA